MDIIRYDYEDNDKEKKHYDIVDTTRIDLNGITNTKNKV